MKNEVFCMIFLLGVLTILDFKAQAQVEIRSRDMPAAGDTIRWSMAINTNLQALSATGANITLNAQNLTAIAQDLIHYKSARETRYSFFFQNAFGLPNEQFAFLNNLPIPGGFQISNVWDFFANNGTQFSLIGRGLTINGFPAPTYFQDPDEIYELPLRYGDKDTTTFRYVASVPGGPGYTSAGRRITRVDGWGKVILPIGVYDCIRVYSEVFYNDTIRLPATGTPFPLPPIPVAYRRVEIKWLAQGVKLPVLQISTLFPPFGPGNTTINYLDINRLPKANFTYQGAEIGCPPITFQFENHSERADFFFWDFGDGITSTQRNPVHTYWEAGAKNVRLIARNRLGADTLTLNNVTKVLEFQLSFEALPQRNSLINGLAPIRFINTSDEFDGDGYRYWWEFGDGGYSNERSPTYNYRSPGWYTVTLTGEDPLGCKNTLIKTRYIQIEGPTSAQSDLPISSFLQLYPNPAKEQLCLNINWVSLGLQRLDLEFFDARGSLLYQQSIKSDSETPYFILSRSPLWQSGIYTLKIKGGAYQWIQKVIFYD
jgi:PKD repeat protein